MSIPSPDALPNLVVVGYPRTGTTWLYNVLGRHPDVFVPQRKELHYFDKEFARGVDWYQKQFFDASTQRYRVDITPGYVLEPAVPQRMQQVIPDARILMILREPVAWLHSWYLMRHREGAITSPFDDVALNHALLAQFLYAPTVKRFQEAFPGRVHVALFEDLSNSPEQYLASLAAWLELDVAGFADATKLSRKTNATVTPAFPWLHRALYRLVRAGRRRHHRSIDAILNAGRDVYRRFLVSRDRKPPSERAVQAIRRTFLPDVRALEALTGLELRERWSFEPDSEAA